MPRKKITDWSGYEDETRAIRAGHNRGLENEHSEAIFATSSFIFEDAEVAAAKFEPDSKGNVYSRFTNPTVRTFQDRLASLDGGEACVATASGMSAILLACMGLLNAGDHVVCSRSVFGSISIFFSKIMTRFGIECDFVSPLELEQWQQAIKPNTRMFFAETPSNPLQELIDIQELSELAHKNNSVLVVDNGFCTPVLQKPLSLGADIVVYTATKYIDGQGRCVGGAVVGDQKRVGDDMFSIMRTVGPTMSPFNAWVFLKGLETLSLRMNAISQRALELAQWLESRGEVEKVFHTGLDSHPQRQLALKQQKAGGGIVSFRLKGDQQQAWQFIDNTELMSLSANLGDVRTIITHPATTTHGRLTQAERDESGISDNLIRIAVGLEDLSDLKSDIEKGFDAI